MLCLWGTVNTELCFVYLLRIKKQKHVNVVLRRGFAATDFKVNWPSKFSILWYSSTSYWETNVTARPARPARAVLPTLYTNWKVKTKAKIYLAVYSIIMSHLSRALKMFLNKKCTVQNVSVRNVRCARFFFFFLGGGINWEVSENHEIFCFCWISKDLIRLLFFVIFKNFCGRNFGMDIILAMFRNVVVYDNISTWEISTGLPV